MWKASAGCVYSEPPERSGWSGTTTTVIAGRAGVSRGAQLHHYPTRIELVIAAVEHLTERRPAVFLFNFRSNIDDAAPH
jgi:AcrR family transcriptional regulator